MGGWSPLMLTNAQMLVRMGLLGFYPIMVLTTFTSVPDPVGIVLENVGANSQMFRVLVSWLL